MKSVLVLTDFSQAAYYAACYACVLSKQLGIENIVLYHSYQAVVIPVEGMLYEGEEKTLHEEAEEALQQLIDSLKDQVPPGAFMAYRTNTNPLGSINSLVKDEDAKLIVMGTTGKGRLEELIEGRNALQVCEVSDVPVVLVPLQIPMQPVGNIIFACDLAEVEDGLPGNEIMNMLDAFKVPLSVVYIGKETDAVLPDAPPETIDLYKWLEAYHPAYHYIDDEDTAMAILEFAEKMSSPIIILVSKKHGFPKGLFHRSVTRQLAYHSTIPLLVLREEEKPAPAG
jgi:nucleotide-binding universal stress UspA family protein